MIQGKICFKDVHFTYPSRVEFNVLRSLGFKLECGKTLALVGESGCGKSTVVSLLERFYNPCPGVIVSIYIYIYLCTILTRARE